MREPYELRVGVCSCTSAYTGRLDQRVIKLGRIRFRLKEVSIDDADSVRSMIDKRCHFFLDVHLKPGENQEKKFNSFVVRYGKAPRSEVMRQGCDFLEANRNAPVPVKLVEEWILGLIAHLTDQKRRTWLAEMK